MFKVIVPLDVMGLPEIDTSFPVVPVVKPIEVTVPFVLDVPAPMAVRKSAADRVDTVLFAFKRGKEIAFGFTSVNKLFPMVVALRLLAVSVTFGPLLPFTLVTAVGVASSIQLPNVVAGAALSTKFLLISVLMAILPTTALVNPNMAASLATTVAL